VNDIDRRTFLASATGIAALGAGVRTGAGLGLGSGLSLGVGAPAWASAGPFAYGVASGDPWPGSVVLWTRVTPTPESTPGSEAGPEVRVDWQVARDAAFTEPVAGGTVTTGPWRDHTVKVLAGGLRPSTTYFYRFVLDGVRSPVGRTRTAPGPGSLPGGLRFGVVSCSNWQAGYFSAYRHLAARGDLDAVLHLGDYLYEYGPGEYGYGPNDVDVRSHRPPHEMVSLRDYRRRHAQYKTDADLQALHATAPWIPTWDDHESANDAYGSGAENHQPASEGEWRARRAAAYRAYDEWMPVRLSASVALGDGNQIYRRLNFGRLADLSMLDLRSYRSRQVAHQLGGVGDPNRRITGDPQMAWLKDGLAGSSALWKLVGNPVMIAPVVFPPLPRELSRMAGDRSGPVPPDGVPYNLDQWDGYTADRHELFDHLADHGIEGVVFLTGDIHSAWANDLPADAGTYPASPSLATEFVCTSVTSNNLDDMTGSPPRTTSLTVEAGIQADNRHVRYLDFDSHGYSVLDVTPQRVQMDYYVTGDRRDPDAGSSWSASWATTADSNTVHAVASPVGRG
jgi:alkaline phosphatase D